jgi:hypothetical protein
LSAAFGTRKIHILHNVGHWRLHFYQNLLGLGQFMVKTNQMTRPAACFLKIGVLVALLITSDLMPLLWKFGK